MYLAYCKNIKIIFLLTIWYVDGACLILIGSLMCFRSIWWSFFLDLSQSKPNLKSRKVIKIQFWRILMAFLEEGVSLFETVFELYGNWGKETLNFWPIFYRQGVFGTAYLGRELCWHWMCHWKYVLVDIRPTMDSVGSSMNITISEDTVGFNPFWSSFGPGTGIFMGSIFWRSFSALITPVALLNDSYDPPRDWSLFPPWTCAYIYWTAYSWNDWRGKHVNYKWYN